jgi:sulfur relay (sulfurtransferase) DsrC/TusE family protein
MVLKGCDPTVYSNMTMWYTHCACKIAYCGVVVLKAEHYKIVQFLSVFCGNLRLDSAQSHICN